MCWTPQMAQRSFYFIFYLESEKIPPFFSYTVIKSSRCYALFRKDPKAQSNNCLNFKRMFWEKTWISREDPLNFKGYHEQKNSGKFPIPLGNAFLSSATPMISKLQRLSTTSEQTCHDPNHRQLAWLQHTQRTIGKLGRQLPQACRGAESKLQLKPNSQKSFHIRIPKLRPPETMNPGQIPLQWIQTPWFPHTNEINTLGRNKQRNDNLQARGWAL